MNGEFYKKMCVKHGQELTDFLVWFLDSYDTHDLDHLDSFDSALKALTLRQSAVAMKRDREWRAAYAGPRGNPDFGPKTPSELRVFIEETETVNRELAAHHRELLLAELEKVAIETKAAAVLALIEKVRGT